MHVLALIPARSGSKGIPGKNIRLFRGKPLLAHSIEQARKARTVTRVIVSTDSEEYARIARQFGAETPFLRPAALAQDHSTDVETFQHALRWLDEHEGYRPEICVHLRPTYPTRRVEEIDRAVELLQAPPPCDAVRAVTRSPDPPFKMWFMDEQGWLKPVVTLAGAPEACNLPRQQLPPAYLQTASVDVVWSRVILERGSMCGARVRGMVVDHFADLDDVRQWEAAEERPPFDAQATGKQFVFDIDGVLATLTPNNDYTLALPIRSNIRIVNRLHDNGNRIVLYTARGSVTGLDWREHTEKQLAAWGVKYDELRLGKPAGDIYVDDRMVSVGELRRIFAAEAQEP